MKFNLLIIVMVCSMGLVSCVSSKKFKAEQQRYAELSAVNTQLLQEKTNCENDKAALERSKQQMQQQMQSDIDALNKQVGYLKENNTQALKQLQDLSVISSSQAESIKKSL